jgi:hypothetical protein
MKSAYRFPAHGLGHHRESCGPAGPGGRGADEDRTADGCALGGGGLFCGIEAGCGTGDGGVDDTFSLMSS